MTILRRFAKMVSKPLAIAALGAVGFAAFSSAAHAGPRHGGPDRGDARCVAGAQNIFGKTIPGTRERATRHRMKRACRVAVDRCLTSLDRKRRRVGFDFPFAECRVLNRKHVGHRYDPNVKCVAKAFTRRGRELDRTRAAEVRHRRRAACRAAINRCEAKLDRKRHNTGRRFPHARCEVVRTQKVAGRGYDAPRFEAYWRN